MINLETAAQTTAGTLAGPRPGSPTPHADPLPRATAGYRILRAWQRALDVAAHAHRLARTLPAGEQDALAADLRRAAAAVPAQIAAGNLAYDRGEHRRALVGAQTALARVETLALLAERLALVPPADVAALLAESADTLRLVRGLARVVGGPTVVSEAAVRESPVRESVAGEPAAVRPPSTRVAPRPPARAARARRSARDRRDGPTDANA